MTRRVARMPNTGDLAGPLGHVIELRGWDSSWTNELIHVYARNRPEMYWSVRLKALIFFPTRPRLSVSYRELTAFERVTAWRQVGVMRSWLHRPATKIGKGNIPEPMMEKMGSAKYIAYTSNKFNPPTIKRFGHYFDQNRSPTLYVATRGPDAVMIRGGNLRLTEDGIDG